MRWKFIKSERGFRKSARDFVFSPRSVCSLLSTTKKSMKFQFQNSKSHQVTNSEKVFINVSHGKFYHYFLSLNQNKGDEKRQKGSCQESRWEMGEFSAQDLRKAMDQDIPRRDAASKLRREFHQLKADVNFRPSLYAAHT